MKVANCKRIRQEIEETEAGQQLTVGAEAHVQSCAQCQAFFDERLRLRQLVASLGTVEAPPDFDFRLRSRLAAQKAGRGQDFLFGRVSKAVPSIAFAVLVLVVGAVFALKTWNSPTVTRTAVNSEPAKVNSDGGTPANQINSDGGRKLASNVIGPDKAKETRDASTLTSKKQKGVTASNFAAIPKRNRVGTQEFSVTPANVVTRETLASLEPSAAFPIEASSQPMTVSLDYATGVSRTISVPALSFGSQRVAGEGMSIVKTSARGVW